MLDGTLLRTLARISFGCALALAGCGSPSERGPDGGTAVTDAAPSTTTCTPVDPPTSCPKPAPTYGDVQPIFQRYCITCHAGVPDGPWPLNEYSHVVDWADSIRTNLGDCTMPPPDAGVPLPPTEDRLRILQWIRCGTPK